MLPGIGSISLLERGAGDCAVDAAAVVLCVRDPMKILLFGASGTAGGAVLQACLDTPVVKEVRVIVRRPLGWTEAKLWELVQTNYLDYAAVTEAFRAVDACLFCLGISVTQVSKEEFVKISHDYAIAAAKMLKTESPGAAFHYISGKGTRALSAAFRPRGSSKWKFRLK